MKNDDVDDIIDQLNTLHIRQTDLLLRLEKARAAEKKPDADEVVSTTTPVGPTASKALIETTPTETTREFAIGDQVKIKNPNPFQTDKARIIKIGKTRITVQTKSGSKIQRAPKNLSIQ